MLTRRQTGSTQTGGKNHIACRPLVLEDIPRTEGVYIQNLEEYKEKSISSLKQIESTVKTKRLLFGSKEFALEETLITEENKQIFIDVQEIMITITIGKKETMSRDLRGIHFLILAYENDSLFNTPDEQKILYQFLHIIHSVIVMSHNSKADPNLFKTYSLYLFLIADIVGRRDRKKNEKGLMALVSELQNQKIQTEMLTMKNVLGVEKVKVMANMLNAVLIFYNEKEVAFIAKCESQTKRRRIISPELFQGQSFMDTEDKIGDYDKEEDILQIDSRTCSDYTQYTNAFDTASNLAENIIAELPIDAPITTSENIKDLLIKNLVDKVGETASKTLIALQENNRLKQEYSNESCNTVAEDTDAMQKKEIDERTKAEEKAIALERKKAEEKAIIVLERKKAEKKANDNANEMKKVIIGNAIARNAATTIDIVRTAFEINEEHTNEKYILSFYFVSNLAKLFPHNYHNIKTVARQSRINQIAAGKIIDELTKTHSISKDPINSWFNQIEKIMGEVFVIKTVFRNAYSSIDELSDLLSALTLVDDDYENDMYNSVARSLLPPAGGAGRRSKKSEETFSPTKIKVLGRTRNVFIQDNKQYVIVQKEPMLLKDAIKTEKSQLAMKEKILLKAKKTDERAAKQKIKDQKASKSKKYI